MSQNFITSKGLLNAPGTSNANEENDSMETSLVYTNKEKILGQSKGDKAIPSSKQPNDKLSIQERDPERATQANQGQRTWENAAWTTSHWSEDQPSRKKWTEL